LFSVEDLGGWIAGCKIVVFVKMFSMFLYHDSFFMAYAQQTHTHTFPRLIGRRFDFFCYDWRMRARVERVSTWQSTASKMVSCHFSFVNYFCCFKLMILNLLRMYIVSSHVYDFSICITCLCECFMSSFSNDNLLYNQFGAGKILSACYFEIFSFRYFCYHDTKCYIIKLNIFMLMLHNIFWCRLSSVYDIR